MNLNDTNYEPPTPEQIRALQQLTPEQQQEWRDRQIKQLNREIYQSGESAAIATAVLTAKPDPLREKSEEELRKDILSAVQHSRFTSASLAQIARYNSIPVDVVESIAQQLAGDYLGRDLERLEFENFSKQIQKIEADEKDAGIRDYKLSKLARRHGLNRKTMMECYSKSLCSATMVRAKPIGEFLAEHLQQETNYLVHGWIPQGITLMLHGDGGTGKTLLIYELLESVLKGKSWNGYQCRRSAALLVQVDEPEVITAERIDIRGISPDMPLQVLSDWQVEQMVVLESEAAKMPRESLIVIDSITAINRNCFFSENDTEYARPILQIRDIARKFGHTVILLHHSNAEGNARGTRAIHNSVDAVWGLSHIDQSDRLLRVQKTRMGLPPGRYKLAFDDETFKFAYRGEEFESEEDFEQAQTYAEKIRLWLNDTDQRDRRFEPCEIAEVLGISKASTRKCLQELWMRGAIYRHRKPGSPYYLYFVKKKQESDPAIRKAIRKAIPINAIQEAEQRPSDPAIREKTKKTDADLKRSADRRIASTPLSPSDDGVDAILQSDPTSDPQSDPQTPRIALRNNPLPDKIATGDTVLVTATAQWIRSGSDKLPWQEVPKSQRSAPQIPINVLGQPLFDELIAGGKVIETRGDRSRVRHQKTGRTSMFFNTDLRVLREGES